MMFNKRSSAPKSEGGSNLFIKIPDGGEIRAVLVGEIHEFHTKWVDGRSSVTSEDDPDGKIRFRVNAVVQEDGKLQCKILEFGWSVYTQLEEINAEYPLETIKVKISRKGTKLDTTYHAMPLLGDKDKLSPAHLKSIAAIPLNILEHKPQVEKDTVEEFGF